MGAKSFSILHIASDEKFINAANYIFEKAFPGKNQFVITKPKSQRKLNHVKEAVNVTCIFFSSKLVKQLADMSEEFECIVLHGITDINSSVFLSSRSKHKFIGILWGAELYTEANFPERSFKGELTSAIQLPAPGPSLTERIKRWMKVFVNMKPVTLPNASNRAAMELPYFGVPYQEEMDLFKEKRILSSSCRLIPFTYYPIEFIMKDNELLKINGNDIMVGNSASFTNNHLEAFEMIKQINGASRKVVVPLSYGDARYADVIQSKGVELFNENFKPLRQFMTLSDYQVELMKCGVVIMNQYRQQAVGNVLMMLWMGSKVYLNESNSLYHFLKRKGFYIFNIEKELNGRNPSVFDNLSVSEMSHNQKLLRDLIGEDSVVANLKQSISTYFEICNS